MPNIEFAYPPLENPQRYMPDIFYPDFTRETIQRKEDLESYPVILTDEKGDRYAFAFYDK